MRGLQLLVRRRSPIHRWHGKQELPRTLTTAVEVPPPYRRDSRNDNCLSSSGRQAHYDVRP